MNECNNHAYMHKFPILCTVYTLHSRSSQHHKLISGASNICNMIWRRKIQTRNNSHCNRNYSLYSN